MKKLNQATKIPLRNIVEDRLKLQSTRNHLFYCKVGDIDYDKLYSEDFGKTYTNWAPYERAYFLQAIAGIKWKNLQRKIESHFLIEQK